jgi:DNA-binding transcriptional regulator/RsmH inhibitor MraZ
MEFNSKLDDKNRAVCPQKYKTAIGDTAISVLFSKIF